MKLDSVWVLEVYELLLNNDVVANGSDKFAHSLKWDAKGEPEHAAGPIQVEIAHRWLFRICLLEFVPAAADVRIVACLTQVTLEAIQLNIWVPHTWRFGLYQRLTVAFAFEAHIRELDSIRWLQIIGLEITVTLTYLLVFLLGWCA